MGAVNVGTPVDTATRILDVAERLAMVRGFNSFSYADVARELAITKAALHYHFASKSELGEALVARYASRFVEALSNIDEQVSKPESRLESYVGLYQGVLSEHRMCLCGMMAAEFDTLSPGLRESIVEFFNRNEIWLSRVLKDGRDSGSLEFSGTPRKTSRMLISALEGAMLLSRLYGDETTFQTSASFLVAGLRPKSTVTERSAR